MNGLVLLVFAAVMLAVITACSAVEQQAENAGVLALPVEDPHECLGEDDCKVMVLRRRMKSLASVSGDVRRRSADRTCAASRELAVRRPNRSVERAAVTRKTLAWVVRAGNDCAAPVPPFTRLYAPWSAVHGGEHASSWNYFRETVRVVHARVEALTGAALHHHESGVMVATAGYDAPPQCDSQFFDSETGRFEAQVTTQHRHFAALLCLSPSDDPVHLRYCDGTAVHLTGGTLVVHECGAANCWSVDRVLAGRLYVLTCWFTRSQRHAVPLPGPRARSLKRKGNTGRSSWRAVEI